MSNISAQAIWQLNHADLQTLLDSKQIKPKNNIVRFYTPNFGPQFCNQSNAFPTVSITGNNCALNCRHCDGQVLKTMHSATTPEKLYNLGVKFKENSALGVLVSGGCLSNGAVPLDDFAEVLGRLKRELGLTVFVHTGIIGRKTALLLKKASVDAALIDVIGSQETAQRTCKSKFSVQDYEDSLKALDNAELAVVPHVIAGLDDGKLGGEYNALEIIAKFSRPKALVVIAFMPIPRTEMAQTPPPHPLDIAKVTAVARQMFPNTPLALGCMRPKGKSRAETDVLALKAGVDAIAFPSNKAVEYAKTKRYKLIFSSFCCAQMYLDITR